MQDANLSFLARQLLLTELQGSPVPTAPDLGCMCRICGGKLWVGMYHLGAIPDAEQLIRGVQEVAQANDVLVGGLTALIQPGDETQTRLIQLVEALYIYGYPQRAGIDQGGPDTVQVLNKIPASLEKYEIAPVQLDDPEVAELAEQAGQAEDRLDSPAWEDEEAMVSHSRFFIARDQGQAAGLAGITTGELAARVSVYWVLPQYRGAGVGRELIAHVAHTWADQGKLILSTWTHQDGHLRYYFNKLGFEDRLKALYFQRDNPT